MRALWPDQLHTSAKPARPCSGCTGVAVFITNRLNRVSYWKHLLSNSRQCFWAEGIASQLDFHHVLFAVSLSLSVSPDLTVAKIKALILMALWLAGAHFAYYLRLFLLNLTVISIIDTRCNFQNCPLLGLWLCFFPSFLWTAACLCSVQFGFNPFTSYTEFLSSSSKRIAENR